MGELTALLNQAAADPNAAAQAHELLHDELEALAHNRLECFYRNKPNAHRPISTHTLALAAFNKAVQRGQKSGVPFEYKDREAFLRYIRWKMRLLIIDKIRQHKARLESARHYQNDREHRSLSRLEETLTAINEAVLKLSPEEQEYVHKKFWQQMTLEQIVEEKGGSVPGVSRMLARITDKLRLLLNNSSFDLNCTT